PLNSAKDQVNDFLDSLDNNIIASLAYNCSSSFSSLESERLLAVLASVKGSLTAYKDASCAAKDSSVSIKEDKPAEHFLLEDFYIASEYQEILLPSGSKTSEAPHAASLSPVLSSNDILDPLIQKSIFSGNLPKKPLPPATCTPLSKLFSQNVLPFEGCPSHAALKQCEKSFVCIEEIFVKLAHSLQQPVSLVKKMYFSIMWSQKRSLMMWTHSNKLNKAMDSLEAEFKGLATPQPAAEDEEDLSDKLKIIKEDLKKIKKNKIAVIATAEPTTYNTPNIHAQAIVANGKIWIRKPASKSATLTYIKKKQVVINVESRDNQPQKPYIVCTISSSDSEELFPTPTFKKHNSTIKTHSDSDDPGRKKQPSVKQPPSLPPVKQ
ncbi:hypothetical protein C0995_015058, partial [Termitomyces sp. Mi166